MAMVRKIFAAEKSAVNVNFLHGRKLKKGDLKS